MTLSASSESLEVPKRAVETGWLSISKREISKLQILRESRGKWLLQENGTEVND